MRPSTLQRAKQKLRSLALPIAIAIGIVFYKPLSLLSGSIPFFIVGMLFFSFLNIKFSQLRITRLHFLLGGIQLLLGVVSYLLLKRFAPESVAQGVMLCFLAPAASASPVVIGMLGGSIALAVSYVLFITVGIAFIAPIFFSLIAPLEEGFLATVWHILRGVLPLILLPLVIALGMRYRWSKAHAKLLRFSRVAFWLWVVSLALIIAKVVHYMSLEPKSEVPTMVFLALGGLVACLAQFAIGKCISKRFLGETITLGQALGQKNTSLAIWMAQTYLNPLSGVALAAYSIWQNLINAMQLAYVARATRENNKQ